MTSLERWVKGISGGFGAALGMLLLNKLQSQPLSFYFYFMIGGSFLLGWLGGSAEERKLRKPLITE